MKLYEYINKEIGTNYEDDEFIDWEMISINCRLTENFIRKYSDKVIWEYICTYQRLSEPFIEEFKDRVNWENICCSQELSEDFIKKHKDEVYWTAISMNQILSEPFIEEFENFIDWEWVLLCQNVSMEFKEKWNYKTTIYEINKEDYVTYETSLKLKEYGFNGACESYYHIDETEEFETIGWGGYFYNENNKYRAGAPKLEDVGKWLRNKHYIFINIVPAVNEDEIAEENEISENGFKYGGIITYYDLQYDSSGKKKYLHEMLEEKTINTDNFNTYAEAYNEAIKLAIKYIK